MIGEKIANLSWNNIKLGERLPDLVMEMTYLRVASHPAGVRDYFPGHHDPAYARQQGQRDIYVNTMFLHGVIDRIVLDWAGPGWFLARRKMTMLASIYVDDIITAGGTVIAKGESPAGIRSVTVDVAVNTEEALRVKGEVEIVEPRR